MTDDPAPPAFALPIALLSEGYRLRPEREDDTPFLMQLYASTREAELAPVPWTSEIKQTFLANQFRAQRHHYRTFIDGCRFDVIEHDSQPIGRLYLDHRQTCVHVVDIALLPAWRGQGVGTAIFAALQDWSRARSLGVGIFVEKFSPALRFYRRLGFTAVADQDIVIEMEWWPDDAPSDTRFAAQA
ncbi:MAG: GNAT family N-acetyltransferase [Rhodopseudomonas sp.]|nr:GNAT family N-acetyltransferase [Rhodopseudomonas sp.]